MIRLENISLFYPDSGRTILRGISWNIENGGRWVLFGPNGSGKTKLLEIITGYLYPSGGSVRRFGIDGGADIRDVRKRIGYLSTPLKERFLKNERLIDVVVSGPCATVGLYDEPGADDYGRARRLLDSAGLGGRSEQPFGTLSDGEKQKALMLRAVMAGPDLLILDEPCMGLDLSSREDFLSSLESLCGGKELSVIYVTHYVEEITPFFKNIFMLKNGGCWYSGAIEDGLTDGVITGLFVREISIAKKDGRFYALLG
ncbi:MAG TPA: ATP-binding cassette domain-containing protein [Spirochaetota bacterium]|nr:ATP-binding cassette domain-containing protein [Spirochaetota bacterium]HPC42567.1 ATP-binding cassette domain-containing protein [Spirochaetota bacterium]HPL15521.1 ATP-binding cassette domain-containing protein [Spirochaetota bacterium]HQJ71906.1 ATP-binding cassette domain-containing protein [Spirochaetota bacterium]HRS78710.1 ATP-binding cassette domain-containing protein [Spirochaetota bacterium]